MDQNKPNPSADDLMSQGLIASMAGKSVEAIAHWQSAANLAPTSGAPHFLIASELIAMGEVERAEAAFATAVILAPNLLVARYQLGLLQFTSGRTAVALMTWQPLLSNIQSDSVAPALAHFVQGYAYLAQDAFDDALASFEAGLLVNTSNPPLSADVRLVMDRIQNLRSANTTGSAQSISSSPFEDQAEDGSHESHVLLANYQPQNKPH